MPNLPKTTPGWVSPTLLENGAARLRFRFEFELYRNALARLRCSHDRRWIARFSKQLRFDPASRLITAMPALVSEQGLKRALLSYAHQGRWLGRHRIVVFLNGSSSFSRHEYGKLLRERLRDIRETRKQAPELRIQVIHGMLAPRGMSPCGMGRVRGLLVDSIAHAAMRSGLRDAIIVSNDADQWSISPNYFRGITRFFRANPQADGAEGTVLFGDDRDRRVLPELALNNRYLRCIEKLRGQDGRSLVSFHFWGANSFYRLSSYCAVGGYRYELKSGEDVDLARRIETARVTGSTFFLGFHGKSLGRIRGAELVTDPRRLLLAILRGRTLQELLTDPSWAPLPRRDELAELRELYTSKKGLLQPEDVKRAHRGDPKALIKVKRRSERVFMSNIEADPLHPSYVRPLARSFGIRMADRRLERRRKTFTRPGRPDRLGKNPFQRQSGLPNQLRGVVPVRTRQIIVRKNANGASVLMRIHEEPSLFVLESVAAEFWRLIDGKRTVQRIREILIRRHAPPEAAFDREIALLLRDLARNKLLSIRYKPRRPARSSGS